jgi:prephenate dehydratase
MPKSRSAGWRIAFQGEPGAYSHLACINAYPRMTPLPCTSFAEAFDAVRTGRVRLAMIPIENSIAGRVADVHHLLPDAGLHFVAEYFQRVNHCLLGVRRATLKTISSVESHVQALDQCRQTIRRLGLKRIVGADTAGSAKDVAEAGDPTRAAIASSLAAKIYGLKILQRDVEDAAHNTTRFVVLARAAQIPRRGAGPVITSFVFNVRNVPAALYKALGGFATNGVNMTKLESYMVGGAFSATRFYADVEGHPDDPPLSRALDELRYFSRELTILGTYPANPFRYR